MSTLHVENLKGLSSGGNANKIIVPSGQTIDASAGTLVPSAGAVVQYQYRSPDNTGFSSSSSTFVDLTDYYVDITPKKSNNILVFTTTVWHLPTGTSGAYDRFRVVDSNNSDAVWNLTNFIGSGGYLDTVWENVTIMHANTAGTTNTMRLQLQVRVDGGGTMNMNWSSNETKTVAVMEIAQ
jgi:hypothetical protein|tara:strand:- start:821 stop:1363 length:543 start_codon:yes stop_codon:yes gene_type:complete